MSEDLAVYLVGVFKSKWLSVQRLFVISCCRDQTLELRRGAKDTSKDIAGSGKSVWLSLLPHDFG